MSNAKLIKKQVQEFIAKNNIRNLTGATCAEKMREIGERYADIGKVEAQHMCEKMAIMADRYAV